MTTTRAFLNKFLRNDLPDIRPGDTVRISQRIKEGEKTRLQPFEGLIIARKHGKGISSTVTVRKVAAGIGVERIFPVHSPTIEKIEVLRRSKVRRAKLYYIREKAAKEIRRKMKQERTVREPDVNPVRTGASRPADGSIKLPSAMPLSYRRQSRRRSNGVNNGGAAEE